MNKKIFLIGLAFLATSSPLLSSQQQNLKREQIELLKKFNNQLPADAQGKFIFDNGFLVYDSDGMSPAFAIDAFLENMGCPKDTSTGGVDPFKWYTHDEWKRTSLYRYESERGLTRDPWLEKDRGRGLRIGSGFLLGARKKLGKNVFAELDKASIKRAERKQQLDYISKELIPELTKAVFNAKVLTISFFGVLLLLWLPIVVSNVSKALSEALVRRRPTILGDKDSDVYGSFLKRIFWKAPKLPEVITNKSLSKQLQKLISVNIKITKKNKGSFWREPEKTPYPHILAYGIRGTGKTLFAKNWQKKQVCTICT